MRDEGDASIPTLQNSAGTTLVSPRTRSTPAGARTASGRGSGTARAPPTRRSSRAAARPTNGPTASRRPTRPTPSRARSRRARATNGRPTPSPVPSGTSSPSRKGAAAINLIHLYFGRSSSAYFGRSSSDAPSPTLAAATRRPAMPRRRVVGEARARDEDPATRTPRGTPRSTRLGVRIDVPRSPHIARAGGGPEPRKVATRPPYGRTEETRANTPSPRKSDAGADDRAV